MKTEWTPNDLNLVNEISHVRGRQKAPEGVTSDFASLTTAKYDEVEVFHVHPIGKDLRLSNHCNEDYLSLFSFNSTHTY